MDTELKEGMQAPDFTLPSDREHDISLDDYRGKTLVLYFYPKDDTPGCTKEACFFRDALPDFEKLGAAILGVSKDKVESHKKFRNKYDLNFPLVADVDGKVCEAYGAWTEKSMYGKKYMGIDRSTFLIDGTGTIRRIWRSVKVPGHGEEVREAVADLEKAAA